MSANGSKYRPVPGRIPGITINLSGVELVLAPLNFDALKEFEPLQGRIKEANNIFELRDLVAAALYLSLRRNYPDITVEEIAGLLDMGNMTPGLDRLAEVSGYHKVASGEIVPAPTQ